MLVRRASTGALVASTALAASVGMAYIVPPPPSVAVRETAAGLAISHVTVGSAWWARGLRPGMTVERVALPSAGVTFTATVGDATLDVNLDVSERNPGHLIVAALAMVAAVAMGRFGLPGRATLLVVAAIVATAPWYAELGLPLALPLACLPILTAWRGVEPTTRRSRRRLATAGALCIGVVIAGGSLLLLGPPVPWSLVWLVPSLAAIALLAGGTVLHTRDQLQDVGRTGPAGRLETLRRLVPLARESRLDGLESERRRVAEQVHDDVLPRLAASIRTLDSGRPDASDTTAGLREVAASLRSLMNDRQLVVLELGGLTAALESYVHQLERDGLPVELTVIDDRRRPPIAVELGTYRIAQTAIDNAVTHAAGSFIRVWLRATKNAVELSVSDDGIGLAPTHARDALQEGHVGLGEMRQRAAQMQGRLSVTSRIPSGTHVHFKWPK